MPSKILIGKITSTHGLKGQVKIMSFAHIPEDIQNYKPIFNNKNEVVDLEITSKSQGKNNNIFIASIKGFENIEKSQELKNTELFINKDQLPKIDDSSFYSSDLVGLDVIDEENKKIGIVRDILNYGASDIIEIEFDKEFKKNKGLEMFSFSDEAFPEISLKDGFIRMIMPEIAEIK